MPVTIGDVVVHSGDIIVGDRDGLVVVARDEASEAIASSLAREAKEEQMRHAIEQGATTAELMKLSDVLAPFGLV